MIVWKDQSQTLAWISSLGSSYLRAATQGENSGSDWVLVAFDHKDGVRWAGWDKRRGVKRKKSEVLVAVSNPICWKMVYLWRILEFLLRRLKIVCDTHVWVVLNVCQQLGVFYAGESVALCFCIAWFWAIGFKDDLSVFKMILTQFRLTWNVAGLRTR